MATIPSHSYRPPTLLSSCFCTGPGSMVYQTVTFVPLSLLFWANSRSPLQKEMHDSESDHRSTGSSTGSSLSSWRGSASITSCVAASLPDEVGITSPQSGPHFHRRSSAHFNPYLHLTKRKVYRFRLSSFLPRRPRRTGRRLSRS